MATGLVSPGDKFNNWTVVKQGPKDKQGGQQFHCKCVCGTKRLVRKCNLGNVKGCGCDRKAYVSSGKYAKKQVRKPLSIKPKEKPEKLPKPKKEVVATAKADARRQRTRERIDAALERQRLRRDLTNVWDM
ncbi:MULTISPECIES: hypothetical protein [unclassified Pseudoalteromonas]|uniref:hypothetical protein n=1 Tax=unclassified Pseudoalteromonas TaxID=194690 RepID=UPI00110B1CD1|nr:MULTISPECIES: hypothetical protein [unclassified Pseudoalteromonas]TMP46638.1 hypothetical protein CWB80_09470 [Pseudoalteromonas sp. S1650]TMP68315.1 hypothetical protein CWB79_05755 [Pseudoalteromonas sp. S1649]